MVCILGAVRTEIWRDWKKNISLRSLIFFMFQPIILYSFKDCKQGAQTTIHCAVADEISDRNGLYFT